MSNPDPELTQPTHLGPYRLGPNDDENCGIYTGDARELAKVIPDESVDLILTDPPFGIDFKYSNGYYDNPEKYPSLVQWIVIESNRVIKPGGLCFVYVAQPQLRHIWSLFPDDSRIFIACKNFIQIRPTAVQYAYDPVIFWRKEGKVVEGHTGRDWFVGNTSPSSFKGANKAKFHSCPRPLDTIIYMMDHFCPIDGDVIDWFMGSGTTAVAAKITKRRWIGFEIDDKTACLARERIRLTQSPLFAFSTLQQTEMTL